ncbi:hypothetical protein QV08_01155 [Gallibacterium salpingitidis]|uniref:Uncharacterized protein n=1 Tax=Gallibacterium salpingitidis TaxID=505341 RepID=A0AB36E2K2_9PAST|nr:hypothetical protein [Gallibacterium salpingitidis]OBX09579.1 hypothetical protein QV08_01155 [Gallibacterium salpingitidis]OBX10435.1 hypothetical protein QV09_05710 [Gallibacterium salpingitidis]
MKIRPISPLSYDSAEDYYGEQMAINAEDQDCDCEDDWIDKRECDKAALDYELTYFRQDSRY